MMTAVSRMVGAIVILSLTTIGAFEVLGMVLSWKDGHDNFYDDRRKGPPATV